MADEGVELAVIRGTTATVRLDHEHLIGFPRIDILIDDVGDGYYWVRCVQSKPQRVKDLPVSALRDPMAQPPD